MKRINFVARNYFPDSPGGAEKVFYEIIKRSQKDFKCKIISGYTDKKKFPENSSIFKKTDFGKILNYFYYLVNMTFRSNFGCNLIHANNIEVLRLTNKPFILTIHHVGHFIDENIRHQGWFNRLMAKMLVFQANKASLITTISKNTKNDLINMGVKNKIIIIPNGIDLKEFKPLKNKKNNKFIITHASRISPEKGQDFSIKCFEKLPEEIKNKCELHIIGHISDKKYYESLKKDNVKFYTNLSDEEYSKKMAQSDLAVFPTFMSEGFGLVVLEAMACGVPIIASDQPAIREAGGSICQYFKQGIPEELIKKIIKIYKSKKLREMLSKQGLKWAKKFSWEKVYKEYKKLYLEMIK